MKPKISVWVWNWGDLASGPSLAAWAAAGVSGVYLKASDGPNVWPQFAAHLATIRAIGFETVGAWGYLYNGSQAEIDAIITGGAGADLIILDAEGEFEQASPNPAPIVQAVQAAGVPCYLSSFGQPDLHPGMRWADWDRAGVDGYLPQVFPDEWGTTPADAITTMYQRYRGLGLRADLEPVAYCYPPSDPRIDPAELVDFFANCEAGGYSAASFWRAGIAGDDVLAALAAYLAPALTLEQRVQRIEDWIAGFGR